MRQNKRKMMVIGITGGVGVGKSTVVGILQKNLPTVFLHCDEIAHELMLPGRNAYKDIVETFGKKVLCEDGTINRSELYLAAFPTGRVEELNACVHPRVREYVEDTIKRLKQENYSGYVLIEAALLLEAGYRDICDEIWYVYAGEEIRKKRLKENRGYSDEKIASIMAEQSDEGYFLQNCDFTIYNEASMMQCEEDVMSQVTAHLQGEKENGNEELS